MTRREARAHARKYVSDEELLAVDENYFYKYDDSCVSGMDATVEYDSPTGVLFGQIARMNLIDSIHLAPESWDVSPEEWRLRRV